jgi:hypothetical protein
MNCDLNQSRGEVTAAHPVVLEGHRDSDVRSAASWLGFAATPTFVVMALLVAFDGGRPDGLCSATQHAAPLGGMVTMYLLMSAFHFAPWLKVISQWRNGGAAKALRTREGCSGRSWNGGVATAFDCQHAAGEVIS